MSPALASSNAEEPARRRVLLPLPLAGAYDYRLPDDLDALPGDFVVVPLGPREVIGVVWDDDEKPQEAGAVDPARLKDVLACLDAPPLSPAMRRFVEWVAAYNLTPPGAVLRMVMRTPAALEPPAPRLAYQLGGPPPARMTAARERVLAVLADGPPRMPADLAEAAGVGNGVVRGLIGAGTLTPVELPPWPGLGRPDGARPGPSLSPDQRRAAEILAEQATTGGFAVTLLEGVTGSGKTEVYFEAIAAALRAGGQVLVLLPEIVLTAQWLDRFEARFGALPVEWHSDIRPGERRRAWRAVAEGAASVVVGARSALFLPFPELGLIVVDEEHDASFKQEDGAHYHARDMAVVRASIERVPIVLASATPALESVANVEAGRYGRLHLPDRHGGAELPEVAAIDMRAEPPPRQRWLSPPLRAALTETLERGEQAMLYLNRRGYAPLTLCGACGHRMECPNCSAWLVEHRLAGRLQCHHCGFTRRRPEACPECGVDAALKACGPGVERLAEEVADLFPAARTVVMTSDTVHGPAAAAELVHAMAAREIDLLIGTQIVAKGHHFPQLTLVGVVDADLGLEGGDLRAAERTYQLLSQVAGRAGRAERPGRVVLQTYQPDNPVIRALVSGDAETFVAAELAARKRAGMPPFGRLAAIIVSGPDLDRVADCARALGRAAPRGPGAEGVEVWGPAPAPLAMIRGRHRQRLLLKVEKTVNLQGVLSGWLARVKPAASVRVTVDVDPYSFL